MVRNIFFIEDEDEQRVVAPRCSSHGAGSQRAGFQRPALPNGRACEWQAGIAGIIIIIIILATEACTRSSSCPRGPIYKKKIELQLHLVLSCRKVYQFVIFGTDYKFIHSGPCVADREALQTIATTIWICDHSDLNSCAQLSDGTWPMCGDGRSCSDTPQTKARNAHCFPTS